MINKFDDNDIQKLKDVVRIGVVSSVNPGSRTARVKMQDTGTVTGDLKILSNQPEIEIKELKLELKEQNQKSKIRQNM